MNHFQILKRAWNILWSYKVLWLFGILLALTTGRRSGPSWQFNGGGRSRPGFNPPPEMQRNFEHFRLWLEQQFNSGALNNLILIGAGLLCLVIFLAILFRILNYVSQTSLIRMVDIYESTGEKLGFRQGFRLGWSRYAWRLFLIDLLLFLPIFVIVLGLIGCGLLVFFSTGGGDANPPAAGIIALIGFAFLLLFVSFIIFLLLSLVLQVIHRFAVLDDQGVIASIRSGFRLLFRRFFDVLVFWLILIGLWIGFTILLIPVVLGLLGVGVLVGGGLAAAAYFLFQAISGSSAGMIAALAFGLPVFLVVLGVPLLFLTGLAETYASTAWTLAFRELTGTPLAGEPVSSIPASPEPLPDELPPSGEPPSDRPAPGAEIF